MKHVLTGALAGILAMGAVAFAQEPTPMHGQGHGAHGQGQGHGAHGHAAHGMAAKPANDSPSSAAFAAANDKMHRDMSIDYTGDADVDFVRGMIPHHQGAIDMAKVQIAFGKDPEIRKLAEEIVKAQEAEIAMMKEWLARHGK